MADCYTIVGNGFKPFPTAETAGRFRSKFK
jgi:hypothetical protein